MGVETHLGTLSEAVDSSCVRSKAAAESYGSRSK